MMAKHLPRWSWWVVGIAFIAAIAAAVIFFVRAVRPSLPPGLVEKRDAVARLLEDGSRIADVDIKPLVALEAKKDFTGAVALMEQALAANARQEELNASLTAVSQDLAKLSVGVEPDAIGAKAVEAFGILAKLAEAERKFYADRRRLYEMTRDYYRALMGRQQPPIPENLRLLVDAVNADQESAKTLHGQFAAAIKAFDEAVGRLR